MREDRRPAPPQLKSALGVVGLLAAAVTGGLLLFTLGEGPAIVLGGTVLIAVILTAILGGRSVAIAVLSAAAVLLAVTSAITLYGVAQIAVALTGSDDTPVPPARPRDPVPGQRQDRRRGREHRLPPRAHRGGAECGPPGCARRRGQSVPPGDRRHHQRPGRRRAPGVRRRVQGRQARRRRHPRDPGVLGTPRCRDHRSRRRHVLGARNRPQRPRRHDRRPRRPPGIARRGGCRCSGTSS